LRSCDDNDARLPGLARQVLMVLAGQIEQLEAAVAALERQLVAWHRVNPVSQRLATIPGIGPIIATAIAATVTEPGQFRSGREFAAWLGLVPRQNSTGGKTRLGGISKRGNQYLRRLLINGASANLLRSRAKGRSLGDRAAPQAAKPRRGGRTSEQDGADRLGGDAATAALPAHGRGSLSRGLGWSLRESNDA
jgi:transposase